jgi:hypothetical protein
MRKPVTLIPGRTPTPIDPKTWEAHKKYMREAGEKWAKEEKERISKIKPEPDRRLRINKPTKKENKP